MRLILALFLIQILPPAAAVPTTPAAAFLSAPVPKGPPWPIPADAVPPVINSVKWKTVDVFAAPAAMGSVNDWIFTVSASDNIGVVSALLFCDGRQVAWQGSLDGLPATFTIHFTEKSLSTGMHSFALKVFDGQGGSFGRSWDMIR